MQRQNGISFLELLIVVAVILIIAVIAVPNLLRAKLAANESSAVQTVRQLSTAELSYHATYSSIGYAADLKRPGCRLQPKPSLHVYC